MSKLLFLFCLLLFIVTLIFLWLFVLRHLKHLSLTVVEIKLRCDFLVAYDFGISTLWRNNIKSIQSHTQTHYRNRSPSLVHKYKRLKVEKDGIFAFVCVWSYFYIKPYLMMLTSIVYVCKCIFECVTLSTNSLCFFSCFCHE